jgi:hypothetical protein
MRILELGVAAATALFLAPGALEAQSLAEAAAKEKARRKALEESSKKPAKTYNEDDLARSGTGKGSVSFPTGPDAAAPAPGDAQKGTESGGAATSEKSAEAVRAEANAAWRKNLDDANKAAATYRDQVTKLQNDLNDTGGLYSARRTTLMTFLDETKVKLAESEAKVADLEEQGRRSGYR